jgi:hypothetical protein
MKSYNSSSNYQPSEFIPPRIGQVCLSKIAYRTYKVIAEIINDNERVGLFNLRVRTLAIDRNDSIVGSSPLGMFPFFSSYRYSHIFCLPPKEKYIYVNYLLARKEVYTIRIVYPPLRWRDFSRISIPKAAISDDKLVNIKGKLKLLFNITNLSSQKKAFQINIGFYDSTGKLIGGSVAYTNWLIKPNKPKSIVADVPLELPPNSTYIIQPYTSIRQWDDIFGRNSCIVKNP